VSDADHWCGACPACCVEPPEDDYSDGDGCEPVALEGRKKGGTDAAVLVEIDGADHWLPLSETEVEKVGGRFSDRVRVTIPTWLARDRGLA
jgi:hypothetical protein